MAEKPALEDVDEVDVLLRRAAVYVQHGSIRHIVLDRLIALHGLRDPDRARLQERLRIAGVAIIEEPTPEPESPPATDQTDEWLEELDEVEPPDEAVPAAFEPAALRAEDLDNARRRATALLLDRKHGLISRHRVLSAEEEIGLALLMRAPSHPLSQPLGQGYGRRLEPGSLRAQAFDAMVEHNMRLVWSISAGFGEQKMDWDDVRSSGMLGLLRAVEKFNAERGFKFSTYATWWIRQSITRAIANESATVRLPVHVVDQVNRMNAVWRRLEAVSPQRVRISDVALGLGTTPAKVIWLLQLSRGTFSLDRPLSDDGEMTLADVLEADLDVESDYVVREAAEVIDDVLDTLSEREQEVMRLRYGLATGEAMTLDEVGRVFGLTRERIRQIQEKTLTKLRHPVRADRLAAYYS